MNARAHKFRYREPRRVGAAAVECAVVLPVALFVLFSLLDLGLATTRYNALAEAARRIAREAVLHGSLAPDAVGSWGPTEFDGTAADGSHFAALARGLLPTMIDEDVAIRVAWPDGDNSPRDRVEVEVEYEHQPIISAWSAWGPFQLRSSTTMHIVN